MVHLVTSQYLARELHPSDVITISPETKHWHGAGTGGQFLPLSPGNRKKNGVLGQEMAEILTHAALYAGWPKAWAAFRMAKEVYADE